LAAPAGRADDFAWPRREIGREQAKEQGKGESPVASTAPGGTVPAAAPAAPPKPAAKKQFRPAQTQQPRDLFGGFGAPPAPRQIAPPPRAPGPATPGVPRPPGNVGRSAEVPAGAFTR
jgi:hypothetical protein